MDLPREFLRRCDENTYASDDVELVFGSVIDRNVAPGSASTVVFSSVMHEVHSHSGYDVGTGEASPSSGWASAPCGCRRTTPTSSSAKRTT